MVKLTEINNEKAILINSDNIADDMEYAIKNKIKKIVISSRIGNYKLDNINFVEAYPEIQDLTISTYLNVDYSAIHFLKGLTKLSIDVLAVDNQEIDFSSFENLEDWYLTVTKYCAGRKPLFALVGNKSSSKVHRNH